MRSKTCQFASRPAGSSDGGTKPSQYRRFYVVLPLADAKRLLGKRPLRGDGKKLLHAAGFLVGGLSRKKSLLDS